MATEHTNCYKIFNYNVEVGIRYGATFDDNALAQVNPLSGISLDRAKEAMEEIIRVKITTAAMVMYKMEGEPIIFYKYSDMFKVYMYLKRHLLAWLNVVKIDKARKLPPIEELYAMETFMSEMYPYLYSFYGHGFDYENTNQSALNRFEKFDKKFGRAIYRHEIAEVARYEGGMPEFESYVAKILEYRPDEL